MSRNPCTRCRGRCVHVSKVSHAELEVRAPRYVATCYYPLSQVSSREIDIVPRAVKAFIFGSAFRECTEMSAWIPGWSLITQVTSAAYGAEAPEPLGARAVGRVETRGAPWLALSLCSHGLAQESGHNCLTTLESALPGSRRVVPMVLQRTMGPTNTFPGSGSSAAAGRSIAILPGVGLSRMDRR